MQETPRIYKNLYLVFAGCKSIQKVIVFYILAINWTLKFKNAMSNNIKTMKYLGAKDVKGLYSENCKTVF